MRLLIGTILTVIIALSSWSLINNIANSKDIVHLEAKIEGCQEVHNEFKTHLTDIKDSIKIIESDIKTLLRE